MNEQIKDTQNATSDQQLVGVGNAKNYHFASRTVVNNLKQGQTYFTYQRRLGEPWHPGNSTRNGSLFRASIHRNHEI